MDTNVGKKTGPKPRFRLEDATQAALELGLAEFTLAQVAQRLGVGTSSLYRVVDSRDDLVTAAILHVIRSIEIAPEHCTSWEDILQNLVHTVWNSFEETPGLDHAIITNPVFVLQMQDVFAELEAALLEHGFPGGRERIEFTVDFIMDTVVTTHYQVTAVRRRLEQMQQKAPADSDFMPFDSSWADMGFLQRKIDFIIEGIKHDIDAIRHGTDGIKHG